MEGLPIVKPLLACQQSYFPFFRSIYGEKFADENFKLKHYGAGWLELFLLLLLVASLIDTGPPTCSFPFIFITDRP